MPEELLHVDSMGHYDNSTITRKWTFANATIVAPITPGSAGAIAISGPGNAYYTFGPEYVSVTVGFRITLGGLAANYDLVQLFNTGIQFPYQAQLAVTSVGDGRVKILCRYNNAQSPPSTFVFNAGDTYYLMFQATASMGGSNWQFAYNLWVNSPGNLVLTGSLDSGFPNTAVGFTGWASYIFGSPGSPTNYVEDIVVTKTEVLGDQHVACLFTNAAGDSTQLTPHPTQANWINVSEHVPDDLTTYNAATAINQKDLYNLDPLGTTSVQIFGCQEVYCVQKSNAGPGSFKATLKTAGVEFQSVELFPSADVFAPFFCVPHRKNPNTTNDWTPAEINALQIGPKRIT